MGTLTKAEKETILLTSEGDMTWNVFTYNRGLQRRLQSFAEMHPESCRFKSRNKEGGEAYEVSKGRLSIRLTAPYSDERRKASSDHAKKHGLKGYYHKR